MANPKRVVRRTTASARSAPTQSHVTRVKKSYIVEVMLAKVITKEVAVTKEATSPLKLLDSVGSMIVDGKTVWSTRTKRYIAFTMSGLAVLEHIFPAQVIIFRSIGSAIAGIFG